MAPKNSPNPSEPPPKCQKCKCGFCGQVGHDRHNCPKVKRDTPANQQENVQSDNNDSDNDNYDSDDNSENFPIAQIVHTYDINNVLYCVFDLETTGFSRERDDIIEISLVLLTPDGIQIEDSTFTSFCKPSRGIPTFITALTLITNAMVQDAALFGDVIEALLKFVDKKIEDFNTTTKKSVSNVILVAHNGHKFDITFLVSSIWRCRKANLLEHSLF